MDAFDELVDDLLEGEVLLADFDTGLVLSATVDTIGITLDTGDDLIDIVLRGEEMDTLHLFLEAIFVARGQIKDVNWDAFLTGISDGN